MSLRFCSWISPRPHRSAGWHEPPLFILKHQQDIKVSGQKQQQVTKIDTGAYPNNIPKDWIEYLGKLKLWECKILAGAPSILYIPKVLVSVPHIRDNATKKLPWLLPTHRSCVCVCLTIGIVKPKTSHPRRHHVPSKKTAVMSLFPLNGSPKTLSWLFVYCNYILESCAKDFKW